VEKSTEELVAEFKARGGVVQVCKPHVPQWVQNRKKSAQRDESKELGY